jgi:hypothetical protein
MEVETMFTNLNLNLRRALNFSVLFGMALACFNVQPSAIVHAQEISASSSNLVQVSISPTGVPGNGTSVGGAMTPDGNYIAFYSFASNLVEGDTNGTWDVFFQDLTTGITSLVSVNSAGQQGNGPSYYPSISADGRFIAFYSLASNLVANDTNEKYDVFVHDMLTEETTRVSVDSSGDQADGWSQYPDISSDGRYVVFESDATNLTAEDFNGTYDIFLHDRQNGQTSMVSVASDGNHANRESFFARISSDGRYVVFESYANNLSPLDSDLSMDVYLHDRQLTTTSLVSVSSSGVKGNSSSSGGHVTSDGLYVGFTSTATNLVAGDTNNFEDVFLHNMQTGSTVRVSVGSTGQQGDQPSILADITTDGRYILFASASSIFGGTNSSTNGFIHDMQVGSTTLMTLGANGQQGNGSSTPVSIAADGASISFWSEATNLIPGQTDVHEDVYVSRDVGPQFRLLVGKNGTGKGRVISAPIGINCGSICEHSFAQDGVVSLTAIASPGSTFTGWTGDISSLDNPVNVTMEADKSVTANFPLEEYSLTVTSDHGTVTKTPDQPTYHYGDVVQLSAVPDTDYAFAYWSGDANGPSNLYSITIQGDTTVTAHYLQNGRTLIITSDHGTVTRSPDQAVYQDGDVVQLTASSSAHYTFDHWGGAATGNNNPTNVTISGNMAVTASYAPVEYSLSLTSTHGTITKDPDQPTYHYGDVVSLAAFPDPDYAFSSWSGDVASSSNPYILTIHGNTTVTANYELKSYTLTIAKTGTGNGTVTSNPSGINCGTDCAETYLAASSITLNAVANTASKFSGWSGGGCSGSGVCLVELHADTTLTADFTTYRVYLPVLSKPFPPPDAFGKISPSNGASNINDHPTLNWNSSNGAIGYEYCLDTTNNDACDTTWVSSATNQTNLSDLLYGVMYYWQVRAINQGGTTYADNGTWFNFITRLQPKAGFWWDNDTGTYFYVTPDQNIVREFSIWFNVQGCYKGWISRSIPAGDVAISDGGFSFSDLMYATGTFDTETTAHGTLGLSHFPLCGTTWSGGPYSWSAVWLDASQPSAVGLSTLGPSQIGNLSEFKNLFIFEPDESTFPATSDPARR